MKLHFPKDWIKKFKNEPYDPGETVPVGVPELPMQPYFPDGLVDRTLDWLGYDGAAFFRMCCEEYGTPADACWYDGPIPHPVHFREGMQVRNFLRSTGLCNDWNDFYFDEFWDIVVMRAIAKCGPEESD